MPDILTVDTHTVEGGYPAPPNKLWMVTEKVNHTRRGYSPDRAYGVNAGVKMALANSLAGNSSTARSIMADIAGMWNASNNCIMEPAAVHDGFCYTRALAYFLFGVRALRLESALLPASDMAAIEHQLWRTQVVNCSVACGNGKASDAPPPQPLQGLDRSGTLICHQVSSRFGYYNCTSFMLTCAHSDDS